MKILLIITLSFIFGALFGHAVQIKDDYLEAYKQGFADGVQNCVNQLYEMRGDEDD